MTQDDYKYLKNFANGKRKAPPRLSDLLAELLASITYHSPNTPPRSTTPGDPYYGQQDFIVQARAIYNPDTQLWLVTKVIGWQPDINQTQFEAPE